MHSEVGPVSYVRRRMAELELGGLFSTREFLHLNIDRATLDTTLYRMVKKGEIQRIAFGVFRKTCNLPFPARNFIRIFKDAVFGRKSYIGGKDAAGKLGLEQQVKDVIPTFATNGSSSSFRTIAGVVVLKHASPRKIQEGDSFLGLLIRAFHYLGKSRVKNEPLKQPEQLGRKERNQLRSLASLMPSYMSDKFVKPVARPKSNIDWKRMEREYYPYLNERVSGNTGMGNHNLDWLPPLDMSNFP